jgi:glutathione S-transferase
MIILSLNIFLFFIYQYFYQTMSKVTLGYWKIRGRGQVPRLLLAYTNAIWEDVQYTAPEQWFGADRNSLKLDFPNLPYLIEGDFRIT